MAPKARSSTSSSLLSKSAFTSTKASTSSSLKATLSKSNPVAHKVVVKPNDSSSDSSSTLDVKGYGKLFKVACKEMGDPSQFLHLSPFCRWHESLTRLLDLDSRSPWGRIQPDSRHLESLGLPGLFFPPRILG